MRHRPPAGQPSLFDPPPAPSPNPAPPPVPAPSSSRRRRADGSPQRAAELLAEIHDGRYATVDDSDRVVIVEDVTGALARVRYATDEDAVTALIRSGCAERCPPRDNLSALHGAIRRAVTPLRLTRHGRSICARWNALAPISRVP